MQENYLNNDKAGGTACSSCFFAHEIILVARILLLWYAVALLRSGDVIKTVQGNLGHATAAFTPDVYGHVTDQMKEASALRMEAYIQGVLNL